MRETKPINHMNEPIRCHLYTNTIACEKPRRYECRCRDAGVQYSNPRDLVCTCRNVSSLRRHQEVRYFCNQPIYTYYGSRSFTDIGVGSAKPLSRKKVKRIYLPETDDRGVGSSDLSSLFTRRTKPYRTSHYYDNRNTSTIGVGVTDIAVAVINEKLSPITNTHSGTTSPRLSTIKKQINNVDFGSNTQKKTMASISTQIDEETGNGNIKIAVTTVEMSIEHAKVPEKQIKSYQKIMVRGEDKEKRISIRAQEAERVYSSDSLVEHVHNLEDPSQDKQSHADVMENKLEREYRKMFCTKSRESKDQKSDDGRTTAILKSTSLLRRRFEALRRGLAKKEDSKRNEVFDDKESINVSDLSKKDVSIASDPPSLESRSYSDVKINSHVPNVIEIIPSNSRVRYEPPFETNKNRFEEDQGNSYQGAEGMFKLWGRKFDLEDEVITSPKDQDQNESSNKKNGKKFFFFKKKNKEQKDLFKKGVTTGRCEVGDGLMIKIGAAHTKPRPPKKKERKEVERSLTTDRTNEQHDNIFRKAWLQKFLAQTIESRNSVKIRWNNNAYATSSSTIFEIMENVYKNTGIVFRSKSEISNRESPYFKSTAKQRVNFVQDIQAWMIPKLIPDDITQTPRYNDHEEEGDKNKMKVKISNQKWIIDKSKAFAQKIEVVLHSRNIVNVHENPSADFLTIDIPKGFFSDSATDSYGQEHTSNEEVYKIVEYESPELNTLQNAANFEIGDHLKDIKVTVSLKDSRNFESNIIEAVIESPSKQRDVVIQGSKVTIPTRCNVIGVGIITQEVKRVGKPVLKIQDEYTDDESDHSIHTSNVKSKFAEAYLHDYYRQWTPLGIDYFSWCISDPHIQCCSEESKVTANNQGDGTKSCPNIFEMTSTVVSSCGTSCCSPCGPLPPCDPWYADDKPNLMSKMYNKIKLFKSRDNEKRVLPKDSVEVHKKRKLYALSAKSQWCGPSDKPYSVPSNASKCAQDTSIECPPKPTKRSCWKVPPPEKKRKNCNKHVSIPDSKTLNGSYLEQYYPPSGGILAFKGAAKCEICEKKGEKCVKHAIANPRLICEIPPPHRPCRDQPPNVIDSCKPVDSSSSQSSLKLTVRGRHQPSPPCSPPPKPCPPKPCPKPPRPTLCPPNPPCPPTPPSLCETPPKSPCETPPKSPCKTPPKSPCETPPKSPCETPPKSPCETPPKSPCETPPKRSPPIKKKEPCKVPGKHPCGSPEKSGLSLCNAPRPKCPQISSSSQLRLPCRDPPLPLCESSSSSSASSSHSPPPPKCPSRLKCPPPPKCLPPPKSSPPPKYQPPPKCPSRLKCPPPPKCPLRPKCPPPPKCPSRPKCPPPPKCPSRPKCPPPPKCPSRPKCPPPPKCPSRPKCPPEPTCPSRPKCPPEPTCPPKPKCHVCNNSSSHNFPWPTKNQNSNQCSIQSFAMRSETSRDRDYNAQNTCDHSSDEERQQKQVQCPSKTSFRSPPKVSGIYLKMKPVRIECKQEQVQNECSQEHRTSKQCGTTNNLDDDIVISIKNTTDSTEEIREGNYIKVQDFDGKTLYERRDYTNDPINTKRTKRKKHSVLNDMYRNSNVHVVSTSRKGQNVQCEGECNDLEDAKSETSIANLIEINFKFKLTQGEKTTEYNIGTDDALDRSKYNTKNEKGQTSQEVFVVKDEAEQCTDDSNDKSDINIKIVIKNFKQKSKIQPTSDPFSESITEKFHTVSTGNSAVGSKEDNIYSVHRTVNLDITNESSQTKIDTLDTAANESTDKTPINTIPFDSVPAESKVDARGLEHVFKGKEKEVNDIQNYVCTEKSNYSGKVLSCSSLPVSEEQDTAKKSETEEMSSNSIIVPKKLTRKEKKSILKKVLEKIRKTNKKEKMKQFKDVLNLILTDSDQEEHNKENNDLVKEMTYGSLNPTLFSDTDSMNNYYKTESSESSQETDDVKYPTQDVSMRSVRDSDESYEEDKPETCLCSTFAARLNVCSTGGGCSCRIPAKADEETFCDLMTEEDFMLLNYKTIEYIDVETQNSKYFCNSNKVSVHSKAISSTFENGFKDEVLEVLKAQSIVKAKDFGRVHRVPYPYKKISRHTTLGISDEGKVIILNKKLTNVSREQKDDAERRRNKILPKYKRVTDIWQSYETKKAVLEIFAERTRSDEGGHMVARLPKFVHEKEREIEINYGRYVQSLYQGIKHNNHVF